MSPDSPVRSLVQAHDCPHATNHSLPSITLLQCKNYRKPLLQRHVIRILMLVPIFSIASWASLTSLRVAFWIDPLRDVYEAFVLYTFFQLLISFLGGERSLGSSPRSRSRPWL
jgi:hypothetical protein